MNIEDLAKQDLFDFDQFETPGIYDPYRNNNILKDSNKIQENCTWVPFRTFYHEKSKNMSYDKKNSENNRHSLKKLLQRLESLPSPDKKYRRSQNPKLKTISIMSSTQPIIIKKNKSIFVRSSADEKTCDIQKQTFVVTPSRPSTSHYPSKMVFVNKKNDEQFKVRALIKRKLAQKNQFKMKNKTEKLINFLRENNNSIKISKKTNLSCHKPSSRKLINLLC